MPQGYLEEHLMQAIEHQAPFDLFADFGDDPDDDIVHLDEDFDIEEELDFDC